MDRYQECGYISESTLLNQPATPSIKHWHAAIQSNIALKPKGVFNSSTADITCSTWTTFKTVEPPCGPHSVWILTRHIKRVLNPKTGGSNKTETYDHQDLLTLQFTLWNINTKPKIWMFGCREHDTWIQCVLLHCTFTLSFLLLILSLFSLLHIIYMMSLLGCILHFVFCVIMLLSLAKPFEFFLFEFFLDIIFFSVY